MADDLDDEGDEEASVYPRGGRGFLRRSPIKRGAPLRRSAPLDRGGPLARRTPLRPVNPGRRARRYERDYGQRGPLVRAMPCTAAPHEHLGESCRGRIQAAHVRSRGAGGDRRSLVPLCAGHHEELHRRGIETWQSRYGLDLHAIAEAIAVIFDADGVP